MFQVCMLEVFGLLHIENSFVPKQKCKYTGVIFLPNFSGLTDLENKLYGDEIPYKIIGSKNF